MPLWSQCGSLIMALIQTTAMKKKWEQERIVEKILGKIHISCWKQQRKYFKKQKSDAEVIPDNVKERCKSLGRKEPLLPGIDLDKFNGEPIHVAQGQLTHQNSKVFKKLNKESDNAEGEYFYREEKPTS